MFDNIASLDFGASSVKMMKVKRGFKKFDITSVEIEELDLNLAESDYYTAAGQALDRILMKENLSDSRIILSMPADRVFLRNITFPFSDMSKIAEAIPFEAEENIPYSLDKISMDFQSIPGTEGDSRSVILAAVNREMLMKSVDLLNSRGLYPAFCGLESNALLACHDYFSSVADERIIQIDIGNRKTVVNIAQNGILLFTRAIPLGLSALISFVADTLDVDFNRAEEVMRALDLDTASLDANLKSGRYRELNITKAKLKKIHQFSLELFDGIIENISLTIKAYDVRGESRNTGRVMLTGGGTNIKGAARIFSEGLGYPAVFMPFFDSHTDQNVISRFSVSFGNIMVFMNSRGSRINFLKGEFLPDVSSRTKKIYYLPAFFIILSLLVLVFNFLMTFYLVSRSSSEYEDVLKKKYKRYFRTQTVPADPLRAAARILQDERKELNVINSIIGDRKPFMDTLSVLIGSFPEAEGFDLQKMKYSGRSIVIEAQIKSTADLDSFKKNLMMSGNFESVTFDITDSNRERSIFTMTIKQKI